MTSNDLLRETYFLSKQPATLLLILFAGLCAVFAIWSGLVEVREQHATIERLKIADQRDRESVLKHQSGYGGAAYYSFHLTYDPPSALAFTSFGERDIHPWKHRIRMLALEGQIYETDATNPELALTGRFDFAFVVSVLAPLFIILLLHDLRAAERAAGRHDLLIATAGHNHRLWQIRALVRVSVLAICLLIPLWVGSVLSGAAYLSVFVISVAVIGYLLLWGVLCLWTSRQQVSASVIASRLLGFWLILTFIIPFVGGIVIKFAISSPNGGDLIMLQRETVNDAWDLPKAVTMNAFLERHPEWADKAHVNRPFEWKWYYAFQQVGDQVAEPLSQAYRDALAKRDHAAMYVALLSPPALLQRVFNSLAKTDTRAALAYEQRVRNFHLSLRQFYYPLLFDSDSYDPAVLQNLPQFRTVAE